MPDIETEWAGILIKTRDSDSKAFPGLVRTALGRINSRPVGRNLLDEIVSMIDTDAFRNRPYLVAIAPKPSVKNRFGPFRWRTYEPGSTTRTGSDQKASDGTGSISLILWDPKATDTPDGARPPFIALAHELIHCMHNLKGTSHLLPGEDSKKTDEMMVTGLRGYEQQPISENRIRAEHGIAYRNSYYGQCSYEEGHVDESAF